MDIQELRAEHFPLLRHVYDGFTPDPRSSVAFIALDNEEIVGRVFLLSPTHIEGPWVREDKRNGLLGARLIAAVEERAKAAGLTTLFAYAANPTIEGYLDRLGFSSIPMTVWAKEI